MIHKALAIMLTSSKEKQTIDTHNGFYSIVRYTIDDKGIINITNLWEGYASNDNDGYMD